MMHRVIVTCHNGKLILDRIYPDGINLKLLVDSYCLRGYVVTMRPATKEEINAENQ